MTISFRRVRRAATIAATLLAVMLPLGSQAAFAATGSVLADFVPGGAAGNGRGIAFDGTNLYYTLVSDPHIYKVTTTGSPLGSITVAAPGAQGGPLSWDGSALWTADYSTTSLLLRVNPASGAILSSCDFVAANPGNPAVTTPGKSIGSFPDGLDWTGSSNWMSGEGGGNPGNWDAELDTSCVIHNSFVAPPTGGDGTSGVAFVGDPFTGDKLWHAVPGEFSGTGPSIFQTDTSGVPTGPSFPAIHLTEDLAFDEVTFAPKCALWANEATGGGPNHLTAYETPCPERPISATGTTINAVEGAPFTGTVATFTDPDPNSTASEYTATIDWGDGTSTAGTISGPTGGPFTVSGTHTYKEEGTYAITVVITDVDTPSNNATAHSTAGVADAALSPGTLTLVDGVEGVSPTNATFTFTDANPFATTADFTATFDWGDGTTSAGVVTGPVGGHFTVTGSHVYTEEGSYTVKVTVVDDGGQTTSATGTAGPVDAPIAAVCSAAPVSPQAFSGPVATLTDTNPNGTIADFTATISWGDATPSSGGTVTGPTGGPFTVSGTHTYGSTGFFTITVSIVDDGGSTATTSCVVLIFGTSVGGNFVIGDGNSAVGTHVTFWGAQWAKLNTLSGGDAPSAFKGFENDPSTAPACGTNWTAAPGNSSPPPAGPLPDFMAVIVSSSVSKSGSTISGDTPHVVVVHVAPGYAPNPGHAGTGTVVGVVC